jgi:hypothetical protein
MSGSTFLHGSWFVFDSLIVTATLPVVVPLGASVTAAGGVLVAVNQLARHPGTAVPDCFTFPDPSLTTEAVVVARRWLPEPALVTVYGTVDVPKPGYIVPVVVPKVTLHGVDVPTLACPVPVPLSVKYAIAPTTAAMATSEPRSIVLFLENSLRIIRSLLTQWWVIRAVSAPSCE